MLSSMKSPNNRDKVRDNKKEIGLEMKREDVEGKRVRNRKPESQWKVDRVLAIHSLRFQNKEETVRNEREDYSDCHKRDLQENGS